MNGFCLGLSCVGVSAILWKTNGEIWVYKLFIQVVLVAFFIFMAVVTDEK